jgi:hypothetical protein
MELPDGLVGSRDMIIRLLNEKPLLRSASVEEGIKKVYDYAESWMRTNGRKFDVDIDLTSKRTKVREEMIREKITGRSPFEPQQHSIEDIEQRTAPLAARGPGVSMKPVRPMAQTQRVPELNDLADVLRQLAEGQRQQAEMLSTLMRGQLQPQPQQQEE